MGLFKTKKYSTEPNSRYHPSMPEEQWKEKHFLLCVDNAPYDFFKRDEDKMQGLFLQGINRHTDKWTISGDKPGTTLTFHTFCRKNEFENREVMSTQDSGLDQLLALFLNQLKNPDEISQRTLQRYIQSRVQAEECERPTGKEIKEAMHSLGYSEKWDEKGSSWVK